MNHTSEYVFPASLQQRSCWFLHQLQPGSAFYNVPIVLRLIGSVEAETLALVFDSILHRHEPLRTVFRIEEGEAVQVVSDVIHPESRMQTLDLSHMPFESAKNRAQTQIEDGIAEQFDLGRGPIIRARLIRLTSSECHLLIVMHHIVADAPSCAQLVQELMRLYNRFRHGLPDDLEPLSLQYGDYAIWQRDTLESDYLKQRVAYWREQLRIPLPVLELPGDRPRPAIQTFTGASLTVAVPDQVGEALMQFCRQKHVTLFTAALASYAALLHRRTGQTDLLVGTPVSNRSVRELEPLVGLFLNTVVLRVRINPEGTFDDLLSQVHQTVLDAFSNDVPFEKLVEELKVERDLSRTPFFQTMLTVRHDEKMPAILHGIDVVPIFDYAWKTSKFDITVFFDQSDAGLMVSAEYNTDLFEPKTIEEILIGLVSLLDFVVRHPNLPIAALDQLLPASVQAEEKVVEDLQRLRAPGLHLSVQADLPEIDPNLPMKGLLDNNLSVQSEEHIEPVGRADEMPVSHSHQRRAAALAVDVIRPLEGISTIDPEVAALIDELEARDVRISLEDGKLRLNAPKGALDDPLKAKLSAHRDGLVAMLHIRAKSDGESVGIRPLGEGRQPNLSFAQRRLWFMEQMEPGSVRYNIGGGMRLKGKIDAEILRLALCDVFDRHEAFRTQIKTEEGTPQVKVVDRSCVPIALVDLSSTPQGDRDRVASAACSSLLNTPLELTVGLVARAQIGMFAPDDHLLALSIHHIVSDGWSIAIIFRDLRTAYDARLTGAAPNLTPPQVRYLDFAAWEQDSAAAGKFDKSSAYWRRTLAGVPPLLDLPCDRPRPQSGSARGARARFIIDASLVDRLEKTAKAHGATLFMALVAAWQALLSRLSGQDDVVIGTAVSNRDNVALEEVVGFLVNNVPLRGDLSGAPSFAELLSRTRLAVFGAFEHADLPFEALVEAVNPERSAAYAPIFQALLTLHNYPMDSVGPGGSAVEPVELDVQAARFDLVLDLGRILIGPDPGKLGVGYEYAADLFDEATILRWHDAFVRLLEAACTSPERSLVEVPLLSRTEADEFYGRLNETNLDHDRARSTHAVLQAAAGCHAEAVAIVAHDGQLSYAEFESHTNQLANLLIERGVKKGSRIAVCLERGVNLPVALAAAWKAGAAYVPLDPAHPSHRLGCILEDAQVACVVSASAFASIFAGVSAPLVLLDVDADAIAAVPTAAPDLQVAADELAYVIYTSGSTGKPKGVEIEHRNLVAFLEAMKQRPGLRAGETLLAVTTPSFDIAGLELWLPLSVGGKVVIASRQETLDGKQLGELLEKHDVSLMQATPATWRLMLESGWQGKVDLTALCGGEAMPLDLARSLTPRVAALWNMYGPTETTIWSTIYRVKGDEAVVPIGRPIANTRVYVLDASGTPTPVGVPGELVITGEGVTRGYRNRSELNAEKFVEVAPLGTLERAFRTGDLARWRAGGQLEFLGRGDGQVKIRGFRIELGEIEARLAGLPLVRSAVAAAREDTPGDKRLVAYVVMAPGATFDEAQARAALREMLPDYMVPSAYVQLGRLPLSPNGKVDRKALPAPRTSVGLPAGESDLLMTPIQRDVASLWREILSIDRVGLHQNFFDLGGHSLLLIKLQVGLKALLGHEIPVVELFQYTTVAAQAERVMSTTRSAAEALARARAEKRKAGHG